MQNEHEDKIYTLTILDVLLIHESVLYIGGQVTWFSCHLLLLSPWYENTEGF